ncbi:MAG: ComEC/Rec2 family competence protein [Clostridia bacterium]|nr:ComEC/Rec2 family competence protein [Clostridia bacterium]
MQLFFRRPLCLLCTFAVLAMLGGYFLSFSCFWWLCLLFLFMCIVTVGGIYTKRIAFFTGCMLVASMLAIVLGFCVSASFFQLKLVELEKKHGETHIVEGQLIRREWGGSYYSGYLMHLYTVDGEKISADVLLSCEYPAAWRVGEVVCISVECQAFEQESDGFAERRYYLSKGILMRLSSEDSSDVLSVKEGKHSLRISAERFNLLLSARIEQAVGDEGTSSLLSALFLGRRDDLDDAVIRDFRRLGLSHLLALSGLHLTFLVRIVDWMLGKFLRKSAFRSLLILVVIGGYTLLAGAPISVVRAGIMLAIAELFSLLWDESDGQTALFLAVSLICLCNPPSLLDLGLWMSAFSTLALILFERIQPWNRCDRLIRIPLETVSVTLGATFATLPFVWLSGGELSLLAIPANLIFVPLVSVLLACAPVCIVLGELGELICRPMVWLAQGVLWLAEKFSDGRGITVSLQYEFLPIVLLPVIIFILVVLLIRIRRKWIFVIPVCLLIVSLPIGVLYAQNDSAVDLIYDVDGKNETIALQSSRGALICDLTDGSYSALYSAANHIKSLGETEVEVLMLTHYHTGHIGAVFRFCNKVKVRQLWLPYPNTEREWEILLDLTENAELQNITVSLYHEGEEIYFGNAEIIPYTRELLTRSSQPLLLLQIKTGERALTYIGGSVQEGTLGATADEFIAESQIVIFGDHGPNRKKVFAWESAPNLETMVFSTHDCLSWVDVGNVYVARAMMDSAVSIAEGWTNEPVFRLE